MTPSHNLASRARSATRDERSSRFLHLVGQASAPESLRWASTSRVTPARSCAYTEGRGASSPICLYAELEEAQHVKVVIGFETDHVRSRLLSTREKASAVCVGMPPVGHLECKGLGQRHVAARHVCP